MAAGDRMTQQSHRRPSRLGAFAAELKQIRIWTHENQRPWFTPADVRMSGQTLRAMAKRNLIKPAGRAGSRQAYTLRSGGWVLE